MKKRVLLAIMAIALLLSCSTRMVEKPYYGSSAYCEYYMYNAFNISATQAQFDSICVADTIPNNLNEWSRMSYTDFETKERIVKYFIVRQKDNGCEYSYILVPKDKMYKIVKRVKEIKL